MRSTRTCLEIPMKLKSPIVMLVAGGALAAGLLAANIGESSGGAPSTTVASSAPAAAPSPPPSASPSASTAPAVIAASAPAATAVATYAGKVNGGGSLAIVIKGQSVVAYLCDGKNEAWLWGTTSGTSVSAKDKTGDTLTGTRGGGKIVGSLTVNGKTWTFTTPSVKKPSGLYKATAKIRGANVVGGWVVMPDGTQVGLLRRNGITGPAPVIDTATGQVTIDGTSIAAGEPDPAENAAG
jgi:serine/threonine-protein kinase